MAYRYGNRYQISMFPERIEDYVKEDDPVRIYDLFVENLNFENIGMAFNSNKVGNSEYDPKAMLKVLLYGYSYGIRSSRKLERAIYHNINFIWLSGGLKPDHKTISNFRKRNRKQLKKVFKECAKLCIKLKVIEGNTLFLDGSKIRGNAGISNTVTIETAEKTLAKMDTRINQILKECDKVDKSEQEMGSLVKLREELNTVEKIKTKVSEAMKTIKEEDRLNINTTDPECIKFTGRQGKHSGYNAQIVTDEKHGLIVNSDVVAENNDLNQFENQINQANEVLGENCENAVADSGYSNIDNLTQIGDKGITVIVPSKEQSLHDPKHKAFSKSKFTYNKENNEYICPAGKILKYSHTDKIKNHKKYLHKDPTICLNCEHYGVCTKGKNGRQISRLVNEEYKEKLEILYLSEKGKEIYKKRKDKVELPFGHFKYNLGFRSFLVRGLAGAKAELSIISTCFNLRRLITLFGYKELTTLMAC